MTLVPSAAPYCVTYGDATTLVGTMWAYLRAHAKSSSTTTLPICGGVCKEQQRDNQRVNHKSTAGKYGFEDIHAQ